MLKLHQPTDVPKYLESMGELLSAACECVIGDKAPAPKFFTKILEVNMCYDDGKVHVADEIAKEIAALETAPSTEPAQDPVPPAAREIDVSKLPPKLAAIYAETMKGSTKKFCRECGMPMKGGVCEECQINEAQ